LLPPYGEINGTSDDVRLGYGNPLRGMLKKPETNLTDFALLEKSWQSVRSFNYDAARTSQKIWKRHSISDAELAIPSTVFNYPLDNDLLLALTFKSTACAPLT